MLALALLVSYDYYTMSIEYIELLGGNNNNITFV